LRPGAQEFRDGLFLASGRALDYGQLRMLPLRRFQASEEKRAQIRRARIVIEKRQPNGLATGESPGCGIG
jgi:hypothetical protein